MKAGQRYRSQSSTAEIIVIKGTDKDVELTCAGEPMVAAAGPRPSPGAAPDAGASTEDRLLVGKRYVDEELGLELLCTSAGAGPLSVDGRTLDVAAAKLLPSSD